MAEILHTITKGLAWFIVSWHVLAFVAVGIILTWEHFTRPPEPTPDEISAEADTYEAQYGDAACQQIGKDMYDERTNRRDGDGRRYRFLRAVSGELVRRMIERSERTSTNIAEINSPSIRATEWPAAEQRP
jgi:hypothetical protein